MAYQWTTDLAVGYAHIDNDHKHLFELVNQLFNGMKAGQANAVLGGIIRELVDYTTTHFRREEDLMQQMRYADYVEHKRAHEQLIREVKALEMRFNGGSITLSLDVFNFLQDWLANHIKTHDRKLGAALHH